MVIACLLLRFRTFIIEHRSNCARQGFRSQTDDVCAAGANIISDSLLVAGKFATHGPSVQREKPKKVKKISSRATMFP